MIRAYRMRCGWRLASCLALGLALLKVGSASAQTDQTAATHSVTTHKKVSSHHSTTKTAAKSAAHKSSAHKASSSKSGKSRSRKGSRSARKRGQQVIDSGRAHEIQEALIREHYLDGEPSGTWDAATQAAMQRYQADQGWQSKTTPDSRALIKLGLGPSKDHLLNPESAMTAENPKPAAKAAAADPPADKPHSADRPQQ